MHELRVFNYHGKMVADSREVAEMVGKQHGHLMRDIAGYIEIMKKSTESKIGVSESADLRIKASESTDLKIKVSDFFIQSTYKDATGRTLPCYLLTKKGCDMVANKLNGEKGVLFTVAYVTAFEDMREALANPQTPELSDNELMARALMVAQKTIADQEAQLEAQAMVQVPENVLTDLLKRVESLEAFMSDITNPPGKAPKGINKPKEEQIATIMRALNNATVQGVKNTYNFVVRYVR